MLTWSNYVWYSIQSFNWIHLLPLHSAAQVYNLASQQDPHSRYKRLNISEPFLQARDKNCSYRCLSSSQTKTFKVSLLFFSGPLHPPPSLQAMIVSYPVKMNTTGCRWPVCSGHSSAATDSRIRRSLLRLSGGGPGLLMQLTCTLAGLAVWGSEGEHCPFSLPTTSNTHLPLLPLLSLSLHVFHRLSHSAEADEEVGRLGGGGSSGAQKALCLGSLHMASFKLAYWTHYGIIYFYI